MTKINLRDRTRTVGSCVGAFEGDVVGGNVGLLCVQMGGNDRKGIRRTVGQTQDGLRRHVPWEAS